MAELPHLNREDLLEGLRMARRICAAVKNDEIFPIACSSIAAQDEVARIAQMLVNLVDGYG